MTNEQRVIHIIKTTPALMTILQLIQDCHLKQGALAAGSIRNTVWQVLSGQPVMFNSDIDVVFFDPERPASDDLKIYQQLTDKAPQYQWQIKNEVYIEVPTCIGAFLDENQIKLIAPYGVDDLINFRCSPIPYYRQDAKHMAIYQQRMAQKQWHQQWPKLQIDGI